MFYETTLTDQERKARAEYFRAWRARNKDKVKEYNRRYWQKRASKTKEGQNIAEKDI